MITMRVRVPYASFRKSYARSFAETYPFPPPATVYGMLLSLVGERRRARHAGVALAFAYARQPKVAITLRKLSRYKYGEANKQSAQGKPDFVETLCGIDFLCWVDSKSESQDSGNMGTEKSTLEERLIEALKTPEKVDRTGILCLGLSDDAVDEIAIIDHCEGAWHWLMPSNDGRIELPIWVDHVGSFHTRWLRYGFENRASIISGEPTADRFTTIDDPREQVEP